MRVRNWKLHDLYLSPSVIWADQIRKGYLERMRDTPEVHAGFRWGTVTGRDHAEDPGIDDRSVFKWIFSTPVGGVDWIDLAQDRDR